MPVEYRTISIVRCDRLSAASITRATSSMCRICGNRRGALGYGVSSSKYRRFSVLHEEEAQRCDVKTDRQRSHLPLAQEMRLVRADMRLIEPVRSALEMSGELFDGVEIGRDRGGGEVT